MIFGLVSVALCLLSFASGITESNKLHFGLDLHNGKEAIQLRARVGDNMSLVASEFLAKHKMNPDGHPQIFNMLQDAGGVRQFKLREAAHGLMDRCLSPGATLARRWWNWRRLTFAIFRQSSDPRETAVQTKTTASR